MNTVLQVETPRAKCVAFNPTHTLFAAAMIDGTLDIYQVSNWEKKMSINVCKEKALRALAWVPCINALVVGGDDSTLYAYNYENGALISKYESACSDFIRCISAKNNEPLVLVAADDQSIKLFHIGIDKIDHIKTFLDHSHYCMCVKFDPSNPNQFSSASLDKTVKVWDENSGKVLATLNGHEKGVNCLCYYGQSMLASGSDDHSIKLWEDNGQCIATIKAHTKNVTSICYNGTSNKIISISEDETIAIINPSTKAIENTFHPHKGRGWCLDTWNDLVIAGFDSGIIAFRL